MRNILRKGLLGLLLLVGGIEILITIFYLTSRDQWWIREFDYVALQLLIATWITLLLVLALAALVLKSQGPWQWAFLLTLSLAAGYQTFALAPYLFSVQPEVANASSNPEAPSLSFLLANVEMKNSGSKAFLDLVERNEPDLIFAMETDSWWVDKLNVLSDDYPYQVLQAQNNNYGMALYSKIPIKHSEVHNLTSPETPAIQAVLELPEGPEVVFWGLHPRPPLPSTSSQMADRELLRAGRKIVGEVNPVIVAGDFNDVPWSYTVRKMAENSDLNDSRIGRGFYNTFNAGSLFLRTPIDHIYLSKQFSLLEFSDPLRFSSDHFALFARLQIEDPSDQSAAPVFGKEGR